MLGGDEFGMKWWCDTDFCSFPLSFLITRQHYFLVNCHCFFCFMSLPSQTNISALCSQFHFEIKCTTAQLPAGFLVAKREMARSMREMERLDRLSVEICQLSIMLSLTVQEGTAGRLGEIYLLCPAINSAFSCLAEGIKSGQQGCILVFSLNAKFQRKFSNENGKLKQYVHETMT